MDYNGRKLVPYIPPAEYDKVAYEFLEQFYPDALKNPMPVPIEEIARTGLGLDVRYVCLSEELDIYGMTIFTDGAVEVYDLDERLYDTRIFKAKTVLIDPEAVKKTNTGCKNNTIAHECVHWYKHRYYYKMQKLSLPRYANYCKCHVDQLPESKDEENIMERHDKPGGSGNHGTYGRARQPPRPGRLWPYPDAFRAKGRQAGGLDSGL